MFASISYSPLSLKFYICLLFIFLRLISLFLGTLNEEQIRLSVLTAVVDQVRRVQKELIYQHQDDLLAIRQTQTGLFSGGRKIQEMINKMQQEKVNQ
ncbi:hypothetical protein Smp_191690 [Schistosoma mansoni]|uniref:hypothetical protein n=1 Tax=Schistosoma mansoni TaxID=6183 RepID=UPI00022C8745|nr:hypothetical protein Smp_191690 [Schistosoma mansoni]|eukprot:XP_018644596.1 hypothetical protein Smp_191690 [Schistosoma mansoni]